ncbi:MAG: helix-turn-helix transcriptional regulator [Burkholderiaceae bacterium]|nr:helix-turn-helix transcriptional regulator [Burkholderiaceae bacterium]
MQALAIEIKVRREQLGYTQEDLAGKCELDRPYISLIEVGKKQPTISVLLRIAHGLGLTLGVFMQRVERRYELGADVPRKQS